MLSEDGGSNVEYNDHRLSIRRYCDDRVHYQELYEPYAKLVGVTLHCVWFGI